MKVGDHYDGNWYVIEINNSYVRFGSEYDEHGNSFKVPAPEDIWTGVSSNYKTVLTYASAFNGDKNIGATAQILYTSGSATYKNVINTNSGSGTLTGPYVTVIHKYYTNGVFDGETTTQQSVTAPTYNVPKTIYNSDITKQYNYNGNTYSFQDISSSPSTVRVAKGATGNQGTFTLKYDRTVQSNKVTLTYFDRASVYSQETYNKGDTITVKDLTNTRATYEFLGWDTNSNATEVIYEVGDTFIINENANFYAVWRLKSIDNGNGISVTKTRISINEDPNKTSAEPGDEIKWEIIVINKSNVTKTITLEEQLPGVSLSESDFTLIAGESKTITATYTVKRTDIGTTIYNTVIAKTDKETEQDTDEGTLIPASIKLQKKFENISKIPPNFYMEYYYGDDLETPKGTLRLGNATIIDEKSLICEWEVKLPTNTEITFKEYNYQINHYEIIGIDGNKDVVKKDHTVPSITFRFSKDSVEEIKTIINYYNYTAITVPYQIEWYDKAGNTLRETSYRNGLESEIATPIDVDYIIDGYIFDETDNRNILSKELKENEENVLKLYFYKPIINLHFVKNIEKMDEESKNMATTLFENMKLDKDENYKFQVTLINQETKDIIKGVLNSKTGLTINDISPGTYLIKESDDIYFDFINMTCENNNNISLTKSNDDYVLTIDDNISENTTFEININNRIELNRWYEDKKEKMNFFKYSQ